MQRAYGGGAIRARLSTRGTDFQMHEVRRAQTRRDGWPFERDGQLAQRARPAAAGMTASVLHLRLILVTALLDPLAARVCIRVRLCEQSSRVPSRPPGSERPDGPQNRARDQVRRGFPDCAIERPKNREAADSSRG